MIPRDTESELRAALLQAERREVDLKRQVEDLQRRLAELEREQPRAKRPRTSDDTEHPEPPQTAFGTNGLQP